MELSTIEIGNSQNFGPILQHYLFYTIIRIASKFIFLVIMFGLVSLKFKILFSVKSYDY